MRHNIFYIILYIICFLNFPIFSNTPDNDSDTDIVRIENIDEDKVKVADFDNIDEQKDNPDAVENDDAGAASVDNVDDDLPEEKLFDDVSYLKVDSVKVQILDKINGEVKTFDVDVNNCLSFKRLRVCVLSVFKSKPIEKLEYIAFVEIWEIKLDGNTEKIYSGWMFSDHVVNILEHAIYDVRIVN